MSGDFDDPGHAIGGSVSAAFEHVTVTAGAQAAIATDASGSADTLNASFGIKLTIPDDRAKTLRIAEKQNDVQAANLQLEQALSAYLLALEGLRQRGEELDVRSLMLSEDRDLAEQSLDETNERKTYGLASEQEIEAATWGVSRLEYSELLIAIDTYVLLFDVEALIIVEGFNDL